MHIELNKNTVIDGLTLNGAEILVKIRNWFYNYEKQTITFNYSAYSKLEVDEKGFENSISRSLQDIPTSIVLSNIDAFTIINAYKLFIEKIKTDLSIEDSKISLKAEVSYQYPERQYRVCIDKDATLNNYADYISQVKQDGVPAITYSYMEYVILYMLEIPLEILEILESDSKNVLIEKL